MEIKDRRRHTTTSRIGTLFINIGYYSISMNRIPFLLSLILFLISKLSDLAISFKITRHYLEDKTYQPIIIIGKLSDYLIFGEIFNYNENNQVTDLVFAVLNFGLAISFNLFISLALSLLFRSSPYFLLQKSVKIIQYIFPYVGFQLFSFNLKLLKNYLDEEMWLFGTDSIAFPILSILNIIWIIIYSLLIMVLFNVSIKTKDPLSAKNPQHLTISFGEKFIIYLLFLMLGESNTKVWVLTILNLVICSLKTYNSYIVLPYYRVFWLKLDFFFNSAHLVLTILNFIGCIFQNSYSNFPHRFLLVFWLFLLPVIAKIANDILNNIFLRIFDSNLTMSCHWLLHTPYILKSFRRKSVLPKDILRINNIEQLFIFGKNKNTNAKFQKSKTDFIFDINNSIHFKDYCDAFLKRAIEKYPKFLEFRIYHAHDCLRHQKNYIEVANYLEHLIRRPEMSTSHKIVGFILKNALSEKLLQNERIISDTVKLDVSSYILIKHGFEELKAIMNEQTTLQKSCWEHYLGPKIVLYNIFNKSSEIEKKRAKIRDYWSQYETLIDKKYASPYLAYGIYLNIVENKPAESATYLSHHVHGLTNTEVEDNDLPLSKSTLFNHNTSYLVVSANSENFGKITKVSTSFLDCFSYLKKDIIGADIKLIQPKFYQEHHDRVMRRFKTTGESTHLDTLRNVIIKRGDGCYEETEIYLKQNPFLKLGINFVTLFRPLKNNTELILVNPDGMIEGTSPYLFYQLRVGTGYPFIWEICPEFKVIHNMIKKVYSGEEKKPVVESMQKIIIEGVDPELQLTNDEFVKDEESDNKLPSVVDLLKTSDQKKMIIRSSKNDRRKKVGSLTAKIPGILTKPKEEIQELLKDYKDKGTYMRFIPKNSNDATKLLRGVVRVDVDHRENRYLCILRVNDLKDMDSEQIMRTLKDDFASRNNLDNDEKLSPSLKETKLNLPSNTNFEEPGSQNKSGVFLTEEEGSPLPIQRYVTNGTRKKNIQLMKIESENLEPISGNEQFSENLTSTVERYQSHHRDNRKFKTKMLIKTIERDQIQSEGSSNYNPRFHSSKLIETFVRVPYYRKKYIAFAVLFVVVVLFGQAIIIAQNFMINESYSEIKLKGDIVLTAYNRADNTDLMTWAVKLINCAWRGIYGSTVYNDFLYWLDFYLGTMKSLNYQLERQVSTIEKSLQDEFYKSNVQLYEIDGNFQKTSEYIQLTAFEAVDKFYTIGSKILREPFPSSIPTISKDIEYLLVNSRDDIMLEFERTVDLTKEEMTNTISKFSSNINIVSGLGLGIVIFFILITFIVIRELNRDSTRFSRFLIKITEDETRAMLAQLERFEKGLQNNFRTHNHSEAISLKSLKSQAKDLKARRITEKKVNFNRLNLSQIFSVSKVWPILIFLMVIIAKIMQEAQIDIRKIKQMQDQMVLVIYYMYITDLVFINLIDMVVYQNNITIRNLPFMQELKRITSWAGETDDYLSVFRNEDGSFDSNLYEILFNTSCNNTKILPNEQYFELCWELSGGTGVMNLIQTNPIYEKTMSEFANNWLRSPQTPEYQTKFIENYWNYVFIVNSFQNYFIVATQTMVNEGFYKFIENQKINSINKAISFSIVIDIVVIITFYLSIRVVMNIGNEIKRVLWLVPIPIFMKNRFLKAYLIEVCDDGKGSLRRMIL